MNICIRFDTVEPKNLSIFCESNNFRVSPIKLNQLFFLILFLNEMKNSSLSMCIFKACQLTRQLIDIFDNFSLYQGHLRLTERLRNVYSQFSIILRTLSEVK